MAQRFPQLQQADADMAVAEIIAALRRTLSAGHRVEIRGFGSFGLNYRPPRIGRNPRTGGAVNVPAKWVPHFKPGKELRELVDAR
ncbi:integration host factor subunit beta [Dechloromonas sp. HYN0024]|uniref:integration host factor subunit beta n=1 Tax=Dechloromonas sp. HYN0024 TaxID=2231055 RepID=UPI001F084753|nr:integration host factor subunit beta [Dechloromonas sp. HYN0024]